MNKNYPPFQLFSPEIASRRSEAPRMPAYTPEVLQQRQELARALLDQIRPLSNELRQLSDEERKAVFFKLEHEGTIKLDGTDLKPIAEPTATITLAVPRSDNLNKIAGKIEAFGDAGIRTDRAGRGHATNEGLGVPLKTINRGSAKDRLSQSLFEEYNNLVRRKWVICEVEIVVPLAKSPKQQRAELHRILADLERVFANGTHGTLFEHEEIKGTVRAVIRCTGQMFKKLVEDQDWQTKISWFDARPEFETFHSILQNFKIDDLGDISSPDNSAPIVCIIDSGITIGNPFLRPVTRDFLLRSFLKKAPDNPNDENGHGSGVASLAAYYALNLTPGATNEGRVWVAGARTLDKTNKAEDDEETHPRLFSLVLKEVVETFVPMGVKIFNLSVNIINRLWHKEAKRTVPRRSWIARTIDRLSREYDIVFVVSTGNILPHQVRGFTEDGKSYPAYLTELEAAIFDPAQAALALTVGSIVPTTLAVGRVATASAIAEINQPSPFTRSGPGVCREIKPELVEFGGNYLIDEGGQVRSNPGTNVVVASNKITPAIANDSGTSFAAPRVAHKLALILADLQNLGIEEMSAPLLKAFAVNSASYLGADDELRNVTESMDQVKPKHWLNVLGYGFPDDIRATYSNPYTAVLFFQGKLEPNKVAFFGIPVPSILADAEDGKKRLTITVAHAPEVQRWGLERYLGTTLKWRLFRGNISREEIINAMSVEAEDIEQPEMPNEMPNPQIGITLRSRGVIQHDVYEWSRHRKEFSTGLYTLAIAAYEKWGRANPGPVPYAVVVRLEDTTLTCSQVYTEVQDILAQIEIRTSG
jgi:Subtilase family